MVEITNTNLKNFLFILFLESLNDSSCRDLETSTDQKETVEVMVNSVNYNSFKYLLCNRRPTRKLEIFLLSVKLCVTTTVRQEIKFFIVVFYVFKAVETIPTFQITECQLLSSLTMVCK